MGLNIALALIDINTADEDELITLTGIGPSKAAAIIEYRETNGSFTSKSEILNVSGIGEATYENIKNNITVTSAKDTSKLYEVDDQNVTTKEVESDSDDNQPAKVPVDGLVLEVPDYIYVGQSSRFQVEPDDDTAGRLVRYKWNFGDATTADGRDVHHIYTHAGTYMVVVESYYAKKTQTARRQIIVRVPEVSITKDITGDILLQNESELEIDLSGMKLVGRIDFVFPSHSVLLGGATMALDGNQVDAAAGSVVTLLDHSGALVASSYKPAVSTVTAPVVRGVVAKATEPVSETNVEAVATETISMVSSENLAAATGNTNFPSHTLPYLGLLSVMSVAVLAIYTTRI